MSPEEVALLLFTAAWVLPAGTSGASPPGTCVGAGNPRLDLASSSVDDLYKGCKHAMRQRLPSLINKELTKNKNFHLAWNKAKKEWMRKTHTYTFPNTMKAFCSVAVVAYTLNDPPLYKDFNTATRTGWTGPNAYARYPFKALHFLLTQAPKEIWGMKPSCATVYRGTNVNFSVGRLFRFGQFTSTSKSSTKAANFGHRTFFVLVSCMGYGLRGLSHFPGEQEVLVPPSEMFRVTGIQGTLTRQTVHAKSVGVCSNHNCAYTRNGDPNVKKCPRHQGAPASHSQAVPGKQLVSGRIFGGQDAKAGAWPWQVSVQRNSLHICGGSLISESWVVSAAHCFAPSVANASYRVQLGENRIYGQSRLHAFALVKRIILHPSYNNVTHQADIALVELKNPIAFTAAISPVGLLDASVHVPAGDTCWVTGWGYISPQTNSSLAETLQELEVLTVNTTICNDHIREALQKPEGDNPIKEDMMCAGPKEGYKGFAWGDGGGPLVCKKDGTWYLAGIASWFLTTTVNGVIKVVPGYPGVYNRLNAHNDWIKANVPGVTFIPNSATPTGAGPSATILRLLLLTVFLWITV